MPNFILESNAGLLDAGQKKEAIRAIHDTAMASGLFRQQDIKVRIREYAESLVAGEPGDFLHVFAHMLEGRSDEQKTALARAVVTTLKALHPEVPSISIHTRDVSRSGYCNQGMVK